MKRLIHAVLFLTLAFCLNSCELIDRFSNSDGAKEEYYRSTTEAFTNSLLNKNYDQCINLINFTNAQRSADLTPVKANLDTLRSIIEKNFGTALEYNFMSSQKHPLNDSREPLPPNTTQVLIEFHNASDIGVLQVLFDDKTSKIDNFKSLNVKEPMPNMTKFWLFGFVALAVAGFNIYAIVLIMRSNLNTIIKWLYSIAIIVLNAPSIQYHAAQGFSFKLWHIQYLMGVNFQKIGYLGDVWEIGIPLAAMFVLYKLKLAPRINAAKPPKNTKPTKTVSTPKNRKS